MFRVNTVLQKFHKDIGINTKVGHSNTGDIPLQKVFKDQMQCNLNSDKTEMY